MTPTLVGRFIDEFEPHFWNYDKYCIEVQGPLWQTGQRGASSPQQLPGPREYVFFVGMRPNLAQAIYCVSI